MKRLQTRAAAAALSALLLTADCMHFTQTRIATIDSFPVLFMMVMFLFMARWMQMSFYHQKLWKTLVPLFFSGVFMGLAIASKWIGCYGAVGLAVLFFSRFITLYKQSVYAKRYRNEDPAFARAADSFVQNGAATLAACVVFFVIVPLAIYCLSYIPYLSAYGEVKLNLKTFERIWNAQVTMFEYHKNLVATHYFSSPWYEWPLIIKPMWYYSAASRQWARRAQSWRSAIRRSGGRALSPSSLCWGTAHIETLCRCCASHADGTTHTTARCRSLRWASCRRICRGCWSAA